MTAKLEEKNLECWIVQEQYRTTGKQMPRWSVTKSAKAVPGGVKSLHAGGLGGLCGVGMP